LLDVDSRRRSAEPLQQVGESCCWLRGGNFADVFAEEAGGDFAQEGGNLVEWKSFGQDVDQVLQDGLVSLGEEGSGLGREGEVGVGFSDSGAAADLAHEAGPGHAFELRADGVVGQAEFSGQFVDSAGAAAEQGQ
jgi:hypothetical protein